MKLINYSEYFSRSEKGTGTGSVHSGLVLPTVPALITLKSLSIYLGLVQVVQGLNITRLFCS